MTNYEKQLYALIATISNTDSPIAFKGGLITHLVLQENGYEKICRMTSDIDADWMGESFDENVIETSLNKSLQNANSQYRANIYRHHAENRSVGINIYDIKTNDQFVKIDMDIKPLKDTQTYYYGTMKIKGVPATEIIADKLSAVSSDAVYKHRAKDLIDLYALTDCVIVDNIDIKTALHNNNRKLGNFDGFLNKRAETEHAYNKLRGIDGKPDFQAVYAHLNTFMMPFMNDEQQILRWSPDNTVWVPCDEIAASKTLTDKPTHIFTTQSRLSRRKTSLDALSNDKSIPTDETKDDEKCDIPSYMK